MKHLHIKFRKQNWQAAFRVNCFLWLVVCPMRYEEVTLHLFFLHLASLVLHFSPLITSSCVSFPLPFLSPPRFPLSFFVPLPLSAFVSRLSLSLFAFLRGRITLLSDLQGIAPHFVPLHLHALMSLEQHAQPTNLQTCLAWHLTWWVDAPRCCC